MRAIDKKLFCLSIASFLLSSATIWLMPLVPLVREDTKALAYLLVAAFWLFLVLGLALQLPVGRRRKQDGAFTNKGRIALLRFFSNRTACVFDALLIAGAAVLTLTFLIPTLPGWVTQAAIFTAVFSLEMHGVFNGRNYTYLYRAHADSINMAH